MRNALTNRLVPVGGAALLLAVLGWMVAQAQPPERGEVKTVRGKVASFTTAPKGEVDGAVLDDGTIIHWPPHLEERFKGIVDKGDRIEATGGMETAPGGETHLEVRKLTNLRTKVSRDNDDTPPPKGKGKSPPLPPPEVGRAAPGNARSLEERVQSLEDKIDQLTREIERLQRKK